MKKINGSEKDLGGNKMKDLIECNFFILYSNRMHRYWSNKETLSLIYFKYFAKIVNDIICKNAKF